MIRYYGLTDRGRKRAQNEDSFLIKKVKSASGKSLVLLAVADGVGGAKAGEVASRLACETLASEVELALRDFDRLDVGVLRGILRDAVVEANLRIWDKAKSEQSLEGMGTTVCACLLNDSGGVAANVGDSRAYLLGSRLRQVTVDHSLRQETLAGKGFSNPMSISAPPKNVITRALGAARGVDVDTFDVGIPRPGALLLCTDGLTNVVDDAMIAAATRKNESARASCEELVRLANGGGGPDNITVVVARRLVDTSKLKVK